MRSVESKKVTVIGGLGFIGSNLTVGLVHDGAHVTVLDNLSKNGGGRLENLKPVENDVRLIEADMLDSKHLASAVRGADYIINCAAETSHTRSMKSPWDANRTNLLGVVNLLEIIREVSPNSKLTQIGTTTQFGLGTGEVQNENSAEFPLDVYSATKVAAEKMVLVYSRALKLQATVLRFPNVYGPRAETTNSESTFNNYFIGLALSDKEITVYGDGHQRRNLLHVDDAVRAITQSSVSPKSTGEVYLAVHDETFSILEIANTIVELAESGSVTTVPWPSGAKPLDIGDALYSNSKIRHHLGWVPQIDFIPGMSSTIDRIRHQYN